MDEIIKNIPWDAVDSYASAMASEKWALATKQWLGIGFFSFIMFCLICGVAFVIAYGIKHFIKGFKQGINQKD